MLLLHYYTPSVSENIKGGIISCLILLDTLSAVVAADTQNPTRALEDLFKVQLQPKFRIRGGGGGDF